ncbi:MAG: DUF1800 domain-containing protein [Saprospiraceae bacterium]|nr:DUF1800 domain-containing protein [Saprospiraceae bacterium]
MSNKIKHLYWRAGFGLSPKEWQERQNWSIKQAVDALFLEAKKIESIPVPGRDLDLGALRQMDKKEAAELLKKERQVVAQQNIAWVQRMANPNESSLLERMSFFWHGHFACQSKSGILAVTQLNTIREHALGNFRDLVLAIAKDPSMIRFLNNQQNRKDSPNENFARELMELFTIGRGHYTEQDIKEAARAFTGWSSTVAGEFIFRERQHDFGQKTFMGKKGNFNGDDIIDIILEKRETAGFITRKIYRHFVNEEVNEQIVKDLANQFYKSNYDISKLMRGIFESEWFYADENMGTKIKSPVELVAGIMRTLNVQFSNDQAILFTQKALGQMLFNPPNVAGWPGGKSWIDNATLMFRLNLVPGIINSTELNFKTKELAEEDDVKGGRRLTASVNLQPLKNLTTGTSGLATLEALTNYLLQTPVSIGKEKLGRAIESSQQADLLKTAVMLVMTLPEYQMC